MSSAVGSGKKANGQLGPTSVQGKIYEQYGNAKIGGTGRGRPATATFVPPRGTGRGRGRS